MNLQEIFIEFIDSIYFPGYAEQLAAHDPEKFTFEFNEFASNMS